MGGGYCNRLRFRHCRVQHQTLKQNAENTNFASGWDRTQCCVLLRLANRRQRPQSLAGSVRRCLVTRPLLLSPLSAEPPVHEMTVNSLPRIIFIYLEFVKEDVFFARSSAPATSTSPSAPLRTRPLSFTPQLHTDLCAGSHRHAL